MACHIRCDEVAFCGHGKPCPYKTNSTELAKVVENQKHLMNCLCRATRIIMNEPREEVGTRLLFENERVRVWDLALEPNEWLEKHVHREDFLFVVIEGGNLKHVDPQNPDNDRAVSYADDLVVFREAGQSGTIHNRLVNVGDAPYRNLVIELKSR